jgi:hypothetical protein
MIPKPTIEGIAQMIFAVRPWCGGRCRIEQTIWLFVINVVMELPQTSRDVRFGFVVIEGTHTYPVVDPSQWIRW